MSRRTATLCLAILLMATLAACGDDDAALPGEGTAATGVVTSVQGDLTSVDSFTIRLEDGSELSLVPEEGLLFEDTSPLSHLSEHQLNGVPVAVTYIESGDAPYVCTSVGDADEG